MDANLNLLFILILILAARVDGTDATNFYPAKFYSTRWNLRIHKLKKEHTFHSQQQQQTTFMASGLQYVPLTEWHTRNEQTKWTCVTLASLPLLSPQCTKDSASAKHLKERLMDPLTHLWLWGQNKQIDFADEELAEREREREREHWETILCPSSLQDCFLFSFVICPLCLIHSLTYSFYYCLSLSPLVTSTGLSFH